jgi:hypothetical protein
MVSERHDRGCYKLEVQHCAKNSNTNKNKQPTACAVLAVRGIFMVLIDSGAMLLRVAVSSFQDRMAPYMVLINTSVTALPTPWTVVQVLGKNDCWGGAIRRQRAARARWKFRRFLTCHDMRYLE